MGVYDMYENVQLKAGPREMKEYQVGDPSPLPDGIYIGWEGAVVILKGIFISVFPLLYDKWGMVHGTSDLMIQKGERRERG